MNEPQPKPENPINLPYVPDDLTIPPGMVDDIEPLMLDVADLIYVKPNFLNKEQIQTILNYALDKNTKFLKGAVEKQSNKANNKQVVEQNLQSRDVDIIVNTQQIQQQLNKIIKEAYQQELAKRYNVEFNFFETPHILRYQQGGHYVLHNDADDLDRDKMQPKRGIDRDFSVLVYLNDDFTGGELDFPWQNLRVIPEPGMLVAFPSDYRFIHRANPVKSGTRVSIVSWGSIKKAKDDPNTPKPDSIVYL